MKTITTTMLASAAALTLAGCATTMDDEMATATGTPVTPTAPAAATAYKVPASVPLLSREVLFGNPTRANVQISPDGKWVSWLAPRAGLLNVYVAPVDDLDAARPITNDTTRGLQGHSWTPDSKYVLTAQDKGGNENFHVYATNVETAETRDLTPVEDAVKASIQSISREVPGKVIVGLNDRNPQFFDLYEVDYRTGESTLLAENPGYAGWVTDNYNRPVLGQAANAEGGIDYFALNEDFSRGKTVLAVGSDDALTTGFAGFSKDGKVAYITDSRGRNTASLVAVDFTTGETEVLAEGQKADIAGVLWDKETYEPLAYSNNYLRSEWTAIDDGIAGDLALLRERFTGEISIDARTDDDRKWVVSDVSPENHVIYYMFDRDAGTLTELMRSRPELKGAPLQPMQTLELTAGDGMTIPAYLTLPPGSDADGDGRPEVAVPMLLWVHGGPWARDSYGYNSVHQWMANRGYAVMSVNYRGSTGLGKAHTNAAVRQFSGAMHQDLVDAVEWAVDEGIAQDDKVAIGGGSYGGYATLVGVTFTPDRFACGVDLVGPSSLVSLVESFPEYWKPILGPTWYRYVGDPSNPEDRADMLARSPISRVDDIKVPLLIGQGGNDPRVTKNESDQLVELMEAKGLPVTYINYTDEGHGFAKPDNRMSFFAAMEGFLHNCLGGRVEPIGDAFDGTSAEVLAGAEYIDGLDAGEGG